ANNIQNLDIAETERNETIESCAYDMCIIISSGSSEPSPQDWLGQIKKFAERRIAIRDSRTNNTATGTTPEPTPAITSTPVPTSASTPSPTPTPGPTPAPTSGPTPGPTPGATPG
ncbi:unnamed protein product, partial [Meganyctiphanes norvegica]